MTQMHINLNADLGESFGAWHMGDDPALLQVVKSANVACGFHGGDPHVMRNGASSLEEFKHTRSPRKDDTRLHVDAFASRPSGGERILRVETAVSALLARLY